MDELSTTPVHDTDMARAHETISEKLLNERVMKMLVAHASCSDARSVMLELVDPTRDGYNWQIGHFDPGRGDRYTCKLTLRRIHEALRGMYDMVGES